MKIGFIDNYLSEWHANNFPIWLKENCEASGGSAKVSYAYALKNAGNDGVTTKEWCDKFSVKACDSIEELIELSDAIVVLSPDNSELHSRLADKALKSGKPVFVDKTFATSFDEAKQMIELAKEYKTPMYSSSALRFASEFDEFRGAENKVESAIAICGGGDFEIYGVHGVEILVTLMRSGAQKIMATLTGENKVFALKYSNDRYAQLIHCKNWEQPYQASVSANGVSKFINVSSAMFVNSTGAMLKFFESKHAPVSFDELLDVMKILDGAKKALLKPNEWIDL